jgi:hypothetical protein
MIGGARRDGRGAGSDAATFALTVTAGMAAGYAAADLGRRPMIRWKWPAVGAMFGCIVGTHGLLDDGGVYSSLLR